MQKRTLYTLLPNGIVPHPPTYQTFEANLIVGGNAIPRLPSCPVKTIWARVYPIPPLGNLIHAFAK